MSSPPDPLFKPFTFRRFASRIITAFIALAGLIITLAELSPDVASLRDKIYAERWALPVMLLGLTMLHAAYELIIARFQNELEDYFNRP
jgi:hypothetical protein